MVIGMFTGWSGGMPIGSTREVPAVKTGGPRTPSAPDNSTDVVYSMRPTCRDAVVLTVVSSEICMRKSVRGSGHVTVELDRGTERVAIATEESTLAVTRGQRTVRIDLSSAKDEDLARLREPLASAAAVRAFRNLATAVDETESDTAERMSVRLTGVCLAQFDGDQGAVRRLSRELYGRYAPQVKRGRRQVPAEWSQYQRAVVRACAELQLALAPLGCWNPARNACAFKWLVQLEAAWYAYVSASATWPSWR